MLEEKNFLLTLDAPFHRGWYQFVCYSWSYHILDSCCEPRGGNCACGVDPFPPLSLGGTYCALLLPSFSEVVYPRRVLLGENLLSSGVQRWASSPMATYNKSEILFSACLTPSSSISIVSECRQEVEYYLVGSFQFQLGGWMWMVPVGTMLNLHSGKRSFHSLHTFPAF